MKKLELETKSKYTSEDRPIIEKLLKEYDSNGKTESKELKDYLKIKETNVSGIRRFYTTSDPGYKNPTKGRKKSTEVKSKVIKSAKPGRPKLKKEKIIEFMFHIPTGQLYRADEFRQTAYIL